MKIFKYEVPVDGRWHDVELRGPVVHVAALQSDIVNLWAVDRDDFNLEVVRMRVHGTGYDIDVPEGHGFVHLGTVIWTATRPEPLVWHLIADIRPGGHADAWLGHIGIYVNAHNRSTASARRR